MHAQQAAALGVRAFSWDDLPEADPGRNLHDTHQDTRDMVGPGIRQESSTGSSNSTAPATPLRVKVGLNTNAPRRPPPPSMAVALIRTRPAALHLPRISRQPSQDLSSTLTEMGWRALTVREYRSTSTFPRSTLVMTE